MNIQNIFFFWGGDISESRLKILQDCVYSTRVFNPTRPIYIVSNSIKEEMLDPKFGIEIYRWDDTLFDDLPMSKEHIKKYYLNVLLALMIFTRQLLVTRLFTWWTVAVAALEQK
jgi:hypothetical protein